MLRRSFTVIGTVLTTILWYMGDRKPRTALAILTMILPTFGFAYTSPPLTFKERPILDIFTNTIAEAFFPAILGFMLGNSQTNNLTNLKLINFIPMLCIGGIVETSGIVVDMVADLGTDLTTSAVFGLNKILEVLKWLYWTCWAGEMMILRHPLSRMFASAGLLCGAENIGRLKSYDPTSDGDYEDVRKLFHFSIAFFFLAYLEWGQR
jgi:hypothetical protein